MNPRHRLSVLRGVRLTRAGRMARLRIIARLQAEGRTLGEIGAALGISGERVRQLALTRRRKR